MEYFVILTADTGYKQVTADGVLAVEPDATRASIFEYMRSQMARKHGSEFTDARVVFFSAEPNRLGQ